MVINNRTLYMLGGIAALLIGGVIAQVLIETLQGKPNDVNPVLAAMAGSAVTALFSGHFFTSQAATLSDMRLTFGQAISNVGNVAAAANAALAASATSTPSGPSGSSTGGASSPTTPTTAPTPSPPPPPVAPP